MRSWLRGMGGRASLDISKTASTSTALSLGRIRRSVLRFRLRAGSQGRGSMICGALASGMSRAFAGASRLYRGCRINCGITLVAGIVSRFAKRLWGARAGHAAVTMAVRRGAWAGRDHGRLDELERLFRRGGISWTLLMLGSRGLGAEHGLATPQEWLPGVQDGDRKSVV